MMNAFLAAVLLAGSAFCAGADDADVRRLSVEDWRDRMKAGWLGQMIGVQWGLPTEFRYQGEPIPDEKVPVWEPAMINGGFDNDDLFVEMTFLRTLEQHGFDVSPRQAGLDFANTKFGLCAANWAGRDNLRRGIAPPDCGHPRYNACADNIDYQIESDYAGLISPGLPQRAIELSRLFGTLVNSGDGVWAGAFMGGMYAEAFFTRDIDAIIDAGLACVPPESQYAEMVRDVRAWHRALADDWRACWRKVEAKYVDDPAYHRGRIDQKGSDVKPNGAFLLMGLLYGEGDLARTIKVAMQCGWDSDCNPSSAAGVLLTSRGTRAIAPDYVSALDDSRTFSYSDYRLDDLFRVCEKLMRENVVRGGGHFERDAAGKEWIVVRRRKPVPDAFRPNWNPPPLAGTRYSAAEQAQISEKPFPGIGPTIKSRERLPLPPIGEGDRWMLGDHPEEYDLALVPFTFAPYSLENEELPIRIRGLTNTVVHLGWGKCHVAKPQTLFVFEDCDNVILREAFVFFHADAPADPPPLYTIRNCGRVKVYNVHTQYLGPDVVALPPVRVEGERLWAGNRPIVLRGINWGWWQADGTVYTENDMRRQAEWGANVLRLAVSCEQIEDPNRLGALREQGVRDIDEVLSWAERYGQYVILDLHVAPGGQNLFAHTRGGTNELWHSRACQDRFLSLWRALATRYRGRNVLAAYELLNEPDTQQGSPDVLVTLQRKALAEIRQVDPDKVIVVSGDSFSNATSLGDGNVLAERNLIYTFHFYEGGGVNGGWLRNEGEGAGARGTCGWMPVERVLTFGELDSELAVLLRSSANAGTAWFDDIELVDERGRVVAQYGFDAGAEGFVAEREPVSVVAYDQTVGHARPGALRVTGTGSFNGWVGPRIKLPGRAVSWRLRGWMRLENATGDSYVAAAVFGTPVSTPESLREALQPVVAFQRKHKVPLLVGEFAVEKVGDGRQQAKDTGWRIGLFEEYGFSWTYWNFRETTAPNTMALHAMRRDGTDFPINETLLDVLKAGWSRNASDGR